MAGLKDAQGSRVFHLMMILPAGLLLLLSLISLSTLAVTNKKVIDEVTRIAGSDEHGLSCVLYTGTKGTRLDPNGGGECTYSIVAGGILGLLALVLTGVFVAKAIMGIVVISIFSVIELVVCAFGTIWAFMVSVTITAGLSKTCSSFSKTFNIGNHPCCSYYIGEDADSDSSVYFYEGLNTSRVTAWLAMALLLALSIFYTTAVIMYFCGGGTGSKSRHSTSTASKDSKPV